MEIDYTAVGAEIRELRKERRMLQQELAERIGVSVPHISNIENGKTKFSAQVLMDLACALEVTPDALLLTCGRQEGLYGRVLEEIDSVLSECTAEQMLLFGDLVQATRKALEQYDQELKQKDEEKAKIS